MGAHIKILFYDCGLYVLKYVLIESYVLRVSNDIIRIVIC